MRLSIFKFLLLFGFAGFFTFSLFATHNRAGEITYVQIGDLSIEVTITTYTKESSPVDKDSLHVFWGDGTSSFVMRSNNSGLSLPNDTKKNIYKAVHTYPGRATYTIHITDPNRIANIKNINLSNSVNVQFHISTTFTFLNPQFQGYNSSPILLQPPIDFACTGQKFEHNPNAFDVDGDSLSYELVVPFQGPDSLVPKYQYPDEILPGPNNMISLNPFTGEFIWDAPQLKGEYNIAIRISEFRNGILINSMIRDMQITVRDCNNAPPVIDAPDEICVIAGETIEFDIFVSDPDGASQLVSISAKGGPFILDPPAELIAPDTFSPHPLKSTFRWPTNCNHISGQYYAVTLRAVDNYYDTTGLADLKTIRVKVVGPSPENLTAESDKESIELYWDSPYACEITQNDYFQGFSVWRKKGGNNFEIDTCDPGMNGKGYTQIGFNVKNLNGGFYYFKDNNVSKGITYCYRITGQFALKSQGGNPYNIVESLASNEICIQPDRDLPFITHVTVDKTDLNAGSMTVKFIKPNPDDLDTLENPGPYRYEMWKSDDIGLQNFELLPNGTIIGEKYSSTIPLSLQVQNLNTEDRGAEYEIRFYTEENKYFGSSAIASSVFLNIDPGNNSNLLKWDFNVPWDNYQHVVYRSNSFAGPYDSIATVQFSNSYLDENLQNGRTYCYYIKSVGTYGLEDIESPLINFSQKTCAIPFDNEAPCAPTLSVFNICDEANDDIPADAFYNTLKWEFEDPSCIEEVLSFNIYYKIGDSSEFTLLEYIDGPSNYTFDHNSVHGIAGCYAISAIDSIGNESELSHIICVHNCPVYGLPNVFTPNGDNINDHFGPFPYRFISSVKFRVLNRWGNTVFESNDPDINWDGRHFNGSELAEGTYYYTCEIYAIGAEGPYYFDKLNGYIELIRGK